MNGARPGVFIHPLADVDPDVPIGAGTRVWQYSIVKSGARIGRDVNVGSHCYIEWGSRLGDNVTVKNHVNVWEGVEADDGVFIGPAAIFTNDVYPRSQRLPEGRKPTITKTKLQYGCTIGAGAMVITGVTIGRFATVGLGSVALESVIPHALVIGTPARQIGWVCECGMGLEQQARKTLLWKCPECRRLYEWRRGRLRSLSPLSPAAAKRKRAASATSR